MLHAQQPMDKEAKLTFPSTAAVLFSHDTGGTEIELFAIGNECSLAIFILESGKSGEG